jgi:ABC-2 type transport system permease protein
MNTPSNTMSESSIEAQAVAPAVIPPTRRIYWALRRELWENRSIYIAPLVAAVVTLGSVLISEIARPQRIRAILALPLEQQRQAIERPYIYAEGLIMGTALIVAVFYCLDALYGERRDRSILFWKSLPVSDLTTVFVKAAIPIVILQLLTWVLTAATQWIMLLVSTPIFLGHGMNVTTLWTDVAPVERSLGLLYHLVTVHGLWYAPIYAWMLLVSAWSPRMPFLWAFLPPFVIGVAEKMAFNTSRFAAWLVYRFSGPQLFNFTVSNSMAMPAMSSLDLGQFLSTSGLWIGLLIAAAFLVVAARLRRYRGPI